MAACGDFYIINRHSPDKDVSFFQSLYLHLQTPTVLTELFTYFFPVLSGQLPIKKKLRGLSPRANYTDRAAAAGRRS